MQTNKQKFHRLQRYVLWGSLRLTPIKLVDVVDLPTEPYHPQLIQQLAVQCKAQRCYGANPDN